VNALRWHRDYHRDAAAAVAARGGGRGGGGGAEAQRRRTRSAAAAMATERDQLRRHARSLSPPPALAAQVGNASTNVLNILGICV
jgi:hypothetical protein